MYDAAIGPSQVVALTLGIGIAAEDKAATYFDKDTAPVNGYLSSDQELSADQCQELSEAWDDGADLGTRVMAKGTKWITTDIDPEKLQLFQTRGYTVAEAARITGVPEHLLGSHDKQSSWGTGLAEQNRGLLTFTIGPDIVTVEVTISDALMATSDYMKLSTEGLMRGSNVEQATYLAILRQNLIINADEWRELMDMEPLPNGQGQEYVNPNTTKNGAGPGAAATDGNGTAQPAA
jgi:HK97 family phage portal protein